MVRNERVPIYLTKTVLKRTSNCIFNMEKAEDCNETDKLQETRLYFLKLIVFAHLQGLFGRNNRNVF